MRSQTVRMMGIAAGAVLVVGLAIAGASLYSRAPGTIDNPESEPNQASDQRRSGLDQDGSSHGDRGSNSPTADAAGRTTADQVAKIIQTLRDAQAEAVQDVPADQVGSQILGDRIARMTSTQKGVRLLARKCAPAPCVTAVEMTQMGEAGDAARQEVFFAAMEAGEEQDAQPTISWTEVDDVSVGYIWFVPNAMSPEASDALLSAAMEHKQALGG